MVAVLASPVLRFGFTVDTVSLFASGCGLLLAVGRISDETTQMLRDPLTGSLSRAAFDAQFERLVAHAVHSDPHRPMGIILLDLDDLGRVNKRRGHRVGDTVLVDAAETICQTLRVHDIVGRVGGDEFAVLVIGERPAWWRTGSCARSPRPASARARASPRARATGRTRARCRPRRRSRCGCPSARARGRRPATSARA